MCYLGRKIEAMREDPTRFASQFAPRMRAGLTMLAVLLRPASLYAQGCAMCYQTAANSGTQTIQALKHGILVMLFPPLVITAAISYLAYRKRNLFDRKSGAPRTNLH